MTGTGLPLDGVRVVEMTHMVMGPTCGMILAQLGAEVIKVEPPVGDKTRSLGGMGTSFFPLFNRGKRSVVLDFAKAEDRDTMHRLLESADVFVENFRDGQLDKQGLGPEELRRKHPHLIVAGHKGFLSGPYEHRPALDEVVQMMSGLAAMTGTREKPQRVGSSANDIMGGMFGAIAILAALYEKRGGKKDGADIRIGLFENCLFLVAQHMVEYEMTGRKPRSMPEREHAWPIYDIFDTAGRRAHLHRRRHRGALVELLPRVRPAGICRRSDLAQHHGPDPGAREDHSARHRGDQGLEHRRSLGKARCAEHRLFADQPPRGSAARPACAAPRRAGAEFQRRRRAVPRSGVAGGVERRQYRRRAEGAGAGRRHRGRSR